MQRNEHIRPRRGTTQAWIKMEMTQRHRAAQSHAQKNIRRNNQTWKMFRRSEACTGRNHVERLGLLYQSQQPNKRSKRFWERLTTLLKEVPIWQILHDLCAQAACRETSKQKAMLSKGIFLELSLTSLHRSAQVVGWLEICIDPVSSPLTLVGMYVQYSTVLCCRSPSNVGRKNISQKIRKLEKHM